MAQKYKPTSGDFVKLVEKDLPELELTYEEVTSVGFTQMKKKKHAKMQLLINSYFKSIHMQIKHIKYDTIEIQLYLKSELFTKDNAKTLTALHSQCFGGIKSN